MRRYVCSDMTSSVTARERVACRAEAHHRILRSALATAIMSLNSVLRLRRCDCLPLHIGRPIGSSAGEGDNVINNETGTAMRKARRAHECRF